MKKLWMALGAVLMLAGCAGNTDTAVEETTVTITNPIEINVLNEQADMSGYQFLEDSEPAFTEISLQESIRFFSEGGSGIIVYSADTCPFCNRAIPVLNEALKEKGVRAYYVDTNQMIASDQATSMEIYNELCSYIESIFETDENGDPIFQIPEVIAVKNGEIVGHHLSLVDSFTLEDSETQMTDEQKEELKTVYLDLITSIAD